MRIIDARSGEDVRVGGHVTYPSPIGLDGRPTGEPDGYTLVSAEVGFFSATLRVKFDSAPLSNCTDIRSMKVPVRYTHPDFFLQKVVFVPS